MKYLATILTFIILGLNHSAQAQENDSLARKSFEMAEHAYVNGQYKETVDFLKYAETYSGGANSRSLYLKIKALDQLSNSTPSYLHALQSALDRFFEATDKSIYPHDKYQEISSIMNQRKGTSSPAKGQPNVNMTSPSGKNAQEAADYDKAVKANTLEAYKEFLDTYSYTPHYGDVQRRYDELVQDQKEFRNHRIKH
jgi:hypothetical protein